MDIRNYIESGVLEMYALNLLDPAEQKEVELLISAHPELKIEYDIIQQSLENYSFKHGAEPHPRVRQKIKSSISNLQKELVMDPSELPLINKFSDHRKWIEFTASLLPSHTEPDRPWIKVLQKKDDVLQMLVVSFTDFEDEVHEDLHESFLILEGQCRCTVGDTVQLMSAGEFMEIPLYEHHNVEVLSSKVVAILQRVSI